MNGEGLKYPLEWKEIMDLLPHRFPFLMIDRVVAGVPGESVDAYKNISFSDQNFSGHFPYMPVFPGVLQLEALAQASAILAHISADFDTSTKVPFLMSMDNVKFRRPVRPGDRLDLHAEMLRMRSKMMKTKCVATVDGQRCCEVTMTAAIAEKSDALGEPSQIANPQLGVRAWDVAIHGAALKTDVAGTPKE